jgi:hypothetical protein
MSIIRASQLILLREIIGIRCEKDAKQMPTPWRSAEFLLMLQQMVGYVWSPLNLKS